MAQKNEEGFFSARDGLRIFWRTALPDDPAAAPAHIALVHGYAEHLGRHIEVITALQKAGYVVHAIDVRGHGQSGGKRAYVERFDDYLGDLDLFLARVREAAKGKPLFLIGHSNGGLISARYLLDHPDAVRGVVLSAPYLRLKLPVPALKLMAGRLISNLLPSLPMKNELHAELLTHDVAIQEATKKDPQYLQFATPRWFTESTAAQATVLRRASELTMPLLVMVGTADPVADPAAAKELFESATSKDKSFKSYEGLLHEIFHEPQRDLIFQELIGWLGERSGRGGQAAVVSA